ncbi:MAG TPA: MBL fold metallo-hydrolase [Anaerolineales bacterium]|nr:MBL fold metallo-hydrolase [Anaerolineales bacterium]
MKQISQNIFIDQAARGVTVGAIRTPKGIICVDTPTSATDARKWRIQVSQIDPTLRCLVYTDAHFDRTLGAQWLDTLVIAQEAASQRMAEYPDVFRPHHGLPGGNYEMVNDLAGVQIVRPQISFRSSMTLHADQQEIYLYSVPGPSHGQLWVDIPAERVLFVGDTLIQTEHPWLAEANLTAWLEALKSLSERDGYILIPGRGQPVSNQDLHSTIHYLETLGNLLANLSHVPGEDSIRKLVEQLLERFSDYSGRRELMRRRLYSSLSLLINADGKSASQQNSI